MSGKKQYHVDMAEWFRSRVATPLVRWAIDDRVLQEARDSAAESARTGLRELRERQDQMDQVVAGLSEHGRRLERETGRRLRDHAEEMERRLLASGRELRGEIQGRMAEQERDLRAEIARERHRREEAVTRVEGRLDDLEQSRRRASDAAAGWLADATAMRDVIAAAYPHERYEPGRLAALDGRLATVEHNLAQGAPEAALSLAQGVYHDLRELRLALELRHREWTVAQAEAAEELDAVRRVIERDMDVPALGLGDVEGEELRFNLGHWSMGELARLREEVAAAHARVRDEARPLAVEELREIVETAAPRYRERWAEIAERAERRLIASELRMRLAQYVAVTLDQFAGFLTLEDETGYAGQDDRDAFYAKLRHPGGDEIVIEVLPVLDDESKSTLRLLSYDEEGGSAEWRRARAREIAAHLRANGVHISDPETESGAPDPALREMHVLLPRERRVTAADGTFQDEDGR